MAYKFEAPLPVQGVKTIVGTNRLEARPRGREFNRALRAEIRDPAWLLARQWQMKEFRAEDRGAPAYAEVDMAQLALKHLRLPGTGLLPYDRHQRPLEAAVEAQPVPMGPGLRLQLGQHWLQLLRKRLAATDAAAYAALFRRNYRLSAPTDAAPVAYAQEHTSSDVQALLQSAGTRALDGYELYLDLVRDYASQLNAVATDTAAFTRVVESLPLYEHLLASPDFKQDNPGVDLAVASVRTQLNKLSQQYVLMLHRLYFHGAAGSAWSVPDMAYEFSVLTEAGPDGPVHLSTREHPGGDLHWYAVDQTSAAGLSSAATATASVKKRFMPTEVQFTGAPNARWWAFEDSRVDFGGMTGDPSDFGRMMLQEFMLLYQNDWFTLPFEVPVGSFCNVNSLTVTDVFGLSYHLQPAGMGQLQEPEPDNENFIDNDAGRWRLFDQTNTKSREEQAQLFVPSTVVAPLVGKPVEQVGFRREEATNLVWAVEQTIPNGFGRGMDGHGAAARVAEYLRAAAPAPAADSAEAAYRYQLSSPVAENWIPFVPSVDSTGTQYLELAELERVYPAGTGIEPRTTLLRLLPDAPYRVHGHEIPPAGRRIDSAFRRARWFDGRTILWFGRTPGAAPAGGSSGLAFDQLLPIADKQ